MAAGGPGRGTALQWAWGILGLFCTHTLFLDTCLVLGAMPSRDSGGLLRSSARGGAGSQGRRQERALCSRRPRCGPRGTWQAVEGTAREGFWLMDVF